MNAEIANLEGMLAQRRSQVQELLQANEGLRVRCATLQHIARVLQEIRVHRLSMGERSDDVDMQLEFLGAGGAAGDGSSFGAGEGGAGGGGRGQAACSSSSKGRAGGGGGASSSAGAWSGLDGLPHLAPGKSLLNLEGVTSSEVQLAKGMTAASFDQLLAGMVSEALSRRGGAARDGDGDGGREPLVRVGERMARLHALLSLWNFDAFMVYSSGRSTSGDGAAAGGGCERVGSPEAGAGEAPERHWRAVLDGTRVTRAQALLLLDVHRHVEGQIHQLRGERARLSRQLQALATVVDAEPAEYYCSDASLKQATLVESLDSNMKRERTVIMVGTQAIRAVFTPVQWSRWISLSWPWAVHQKMVAAVAQKALEDGTGAFAESAE